MPHDFMPTTSLLPPLESGRFSVSSVLLQPFIAFDRDRILDWIARQPLFAGLNADQLKVIGSLAMEVQFASGELIFSEGNPANRFFIISKGYVSLNCSRPDEQSRFEHLVRAMISVGPGYFDPTTCISAREPLDRHTLSSFTGLGSVRSARRITN